MHIHIVNNIKSISEERFIIIYGQNQWISSVFHFKQFHPISTEVTIYLKTQVFGREGFCVLLMESEMSFPQQPKNGKYFFHSYLPCIFKLNFLHGHVIHVKAVPAVH